MTKEEILAMRPGKELNIRVAEDVMGAEFIRDEIWGDMEKYASRMYDSLQAYSENISAAWQVTEMLKSYNPRIEFNPYSQKWEAAFSDPEANFSYPLVTAATAPEAICKATLLTMLEAKDD